VQIVWQVDYARARMNRCDNGMSPPKMERFFVNEIISDGLENEKLKSSSQ
jgi:hypothetical protein